MTHRIKKIVCGALLLGLSGFPGAAGAAELFYNGDTSMLQDDPQNSLSNSLYPGTHEKPIASGNTVIIDSDAADPSKNIYRVFGGYAATGDSVNNTVTIRNGLIIGAVHGGWTGNGDARGNTVEIKSGQGNQVFGGYTMKGNAVDNTVTMYGGKVQSIIGGRTNKGTASGNTVRIYGGETGALYGGETVTGAAFDNTVAVYGGLVDNIFGASGKTAAYNNTVTLSGSPRFKISGREIYGGYTGSAIPDFTGNTLNLWNYSGTTTAKIVTGFQYYNFQISENSQPLKVASSANIEFGDGYGMGGNSTVTGVSFASGFAPKAGQTFTLLSSTSGFTNSLTNLGQMEASRGVTLLYDGMIALDTNDLTFTVTGDGYINPRSKALSEGRTANVAFLNNGADLAAGQGMMAARSAGNGLQAFAAGSAGKSRYDTGSHVDVQGLSIMAGVAWNTPTEPGNLTLGAFFEAGSGTYDTHNSFSNSASVDGDGDTSYYGGGILGRMDINAGPGAFYAEASARMGRSDTDFASSDLRDGMGRDAEYDIDSIYYGAHAGIGYIWNITEAANLDLYTKYFWTRQEGDTVTLSTDDRVKFKDTDSQRWRSGARFGYAIATEQGSTFTPYIGAAYEHEFDGKAEATAYGNSLDAPELKGDTGIGEVGFTFNTATSGISVDLGLQGYTGKREGVSGSVQLKLAF
ncbi:autotransporter outer membrane beta-barrel domain-containing protein [Desulfovibrio sp. OttesenSCG-928-C06]|nr:autotransporter outer membrane beta-barrel domain-containing protein [Desulfovibrio sp. OttesenSCG-928-C06]